MKNTRLGRRSAVRLAAAAVAITAAFILAVMPAAAATINATDVTIRNTAEDKPDFSNSIGVLQQGDKVEVISKTTDSAGNEWYYVELENGNKGYVKAQWVDNGDADVAEEESAGQEEDTQEAGGEDAGGQEETGGQDAGGEEETAADDAWTQDDEDQTAGTPASGDETATSVSDEDEASDSQDAPDVDNGQEYDPYTDPNAQYGINFATEDDGTGHWYIYNYDTDKRIRIDDLGRLSDAEAAAQKSTAAAGRWRAIACILIVTQILTIILLLVLIRSLSSALKKQNKPQITGRTNPKGHRRQGSLAPQDDPAGNLTITRDEDLDL